MKALPTQFATDRMPSSIATPTCSSCCCCCCCAATVITGSVVAAQSVHAQGKATGAPARRAFVALAATIAPLAAAVAVMSWIAIDSVLGSCVLPPKADHGPGPCSLNADGVSAIALLTVPFLALWLSYRGVQAAKPALRALAVYGVLVAAFAVEFIVGGMLIGIPILGFVADFLTNGTEPSLGAGEAVALVTTYLVLMTAAVGLIPWWHRKLLRAKYQANSPE